MVNNNNNNFNSNNSGNNSKAGNNTKGNAGKYIKIAIIVVVVLLLIYICYRLYKDYSTGMTLSPYLVPGIIEGSTSKLVPANQIQASHDGRYGIEFTYSMWLYVKDSNFYSSSCSGDSGFKCIFYKGSDDYSVNNGTVHYPLLQAPGVWLYPTENKLSINMNTYNNPRENVSLGNIPLNKWFNLTIVQIGQSMDVFVNCKLRTRQKLSGVPKINYNDLHVNYFGGFQGYMSKFRYYNYAIQPYEISQVCKEGPGSLDDLTTDLVGPPYLSKKYWLTTGFPKTVDTPQ